MWRLKASNKFLYEVEQHKKLISIGVQQRLVTELHLTELTFRFFSPSALFTNRWKKAKMVEWESLGLRMVAIRLWVKWSSPNRGHRDFLFFFLQFMHYFFMFLFNIKAPGLPWRECNCPKWTPKSLGAQQLRHWKSPLLTTLRGNHPFSHGLFLSLVLCCGRPYIQSFAWKR